MTYPEENKENKLDLKAIQKQQNESLIDTTETKEADRKAKRKRELEKSDFRKFLSLAENRRIAWRILEQSGTTRLSYVHGDTHATALNEGRKSIGLWFLYEMLEVKPDILTQLMRENNSEKKEE